MAKEYVLAIDQGTTSTRAMLFQHNGTSAGVAQEEHEQIYPQAGWVEHDPKEIWERTKQVTSQVLRDNGLTADNIAAVGITNQRETTVIWDKNTGEPVYNAIVWQDTRTQPIVSRWKEEGYEDEIKPKTGLVIATYFSGTKIAWILENVEGARERAERGDLLFGNTDTWVIWNLTGGVNGGSHITDYTNASRTMLFNLANTDWDDAILAELNIPKSLLPELRPSSDRETYGSSTADGPLGGQVPVCGDAGDQQAALFGQACFDVGQAKNTYGTGNFLLQNKHLRHRQLPAAEHRPAGRAVQVGAADHRLLRAGEGQQLLRPGRVDRHHRRRGAVAARQPEDDRRRRRDRGDRPVGGGLRRRLLRAGVLRPVRPLLGRARQGRDRRPHPLRQPGPPGQGDAGVGVLPDPGRGRRSSRSGRRTSGNRAMRSGRRPSSGPGGGWIRAA